MTNVETATIRYRDAALTESTKAEITSCGARHSDFVIPSCLGISCFVIPFGITAGQMKYICSVSPRTRSTKLAIVVFSSIVRSVCLISFHTDNNTRDVGE